MTKSTALTTTTVGALKVALKRVTASTGAKSASIVVSQDGMRVEAATAEGYASVRIPINGIPGQPCAAQVGASLVNIILSGEDADTTLTVAAHEKGARIRYAGANLLLKKPETSIEDLFAQSYRDMGTIPIVTMTGGELRNAARAAVHFMAQRDVRHYLCGVHIIERNGKLTFEGTDGFAMHQHNSEHQVSKEAMGLDVIIPVNSAEAMVSVFAPDESVQIEKVGTTLIGFRTEEAYWVANMISAKYPDCSKFFVDEKTCSSNGVVTVLPRKALTSALSRVSSVAQREGNYLKLEFDPSGLRVTSTDGEQVDFVPARPLFIADLKFECVVTAAVAIHSIDGMSGDHVLLSKGRDPQGKIYLRQAVKREDHWSVENSSQGLLMTARF